MAAVVLARRMGRQWWYDKQRQVTPNGTHPFSPMDSNDSEEDDSMESDSGWNDTESSASNNYWQEEGNEPEEAWSVYLPGSTATTTTSSISQTSPRNGCL
jgi:hypothetical protein